MLLYNQLLELSIFIEAVCKVFSFLKLKNVAILMFYLKNVLCNCYILLNAYATIDAALDNFMESFHNSRVALISP